MVAGAHYRHAAARRRVSLPLIQCSYRAVHLHVVLVMRVTIDTTIALGQLALVLLVIGWLFELSRYSVPAAILILILLLAPSRLSSFVANSWLSVMNAVGTVTRMLIMGVFFFAFLTPYAVVARLFRREAGRRFFGTQDSPTSYVLPTTPATTPESFERVW